MGGHFSLMESSICPTMFKGGPLAATVSRLLVHVCSGKTAAQITETATPELIRSCILDAVLCVPSVRVKN